MSIFKKISLLFAISFILMAIIGFWIDELNNRKMDNLVKDKYVKYLEHLIQTEKNPQKLTQILENNDFDLEESFDAKNSELLYENKYEENEIAIFKESFDDEFIIRLKISNETLLFETPDEKNLNDKAILNFLVFLDMLVLSLMFFYIIKILSPIKNITKSMTTFAKGDLSTRIDFKSNDEIGVLSDSFNQMANSLERLIKTKEELLRDIGHELRTPIAKGKFAIEKIENESQKELLKKIFMDLETLTNELIELEKLELQKLELTTFSAETLILESLSKLYLEDESKIELNINEDFKITADLYYLSIAVKNLIDNALKYATELPIIVDINKNEIKISNKAKELSKELEYYLKPFTQELSHRNGFGLGLSIVKKIIDKHQYNLSYEYIDGYVVFKIYLLKSL